MKKIEDLIDRVLETIPTNPPLKGWVATNPLQDMTQQSIWEALETFKTCPFDKSANPFLIKWLEAFSDEGEAGWKAPYAKEGFYKAWKRLQGYEIPFWQFSVKKKLKSLPDDPYLLIQEVLDQEGQEKMYRSLHALIGWVGYLKWMRLEKERPSIKVHEYLAVRLGIEKIFDLKEERRSYELSSSSSKEGILSLEKREQEKILNALKSSKEGEPEGSLASAVFCIDVRSEPVRRFLESKGWRTYGFAGFFGVAVKLINEVEEKALCPVLIKPQEKVLENRQVSWIQKEFIRFYKTLKFNVGSVFALVEMMGPLMAFSSLKNTFKGKKSPLKGEFHSYSASFESRADIAENALKMMGMDTFAKFIFIVGHKSTHQNNPHKSSLQCGACGGHEGDVNASLLARLLNDPGVRDALKKRGLSIPDETLFIPAMHDTVTDAVEYDQAFTSLIPESLKEDLANTSSQKPQETHFKKVNWSETRPEWGLARNSLFIAGPRSKTSAIDLEKRAFLHSYDWKLDPEGKYLEIIMTAPLIVAEWINHQYFFSTLYPTLFGSGSKITQNVVGKIGIMQGNSSDLTIGLPLQSVFETDEKPYHDPVRLCAIIFAPVERVQKIIDKHEVLQKLLYNEWIHMIICDPLTKKYLKYEEKAWVEK